MGTTTAIKWTDHTFNPWWGCQRVSPGCEHCYAETFAKRTGHDVWGKQAERRFFGEKHWNEPLRWNRDALATFGRPARVFCASMADVFEDRPDLAVERRRLFELIDSTPHLHWQLLTKRPENVMRLLAQMGRAVIPPNVWMGTTVEDQRRADERIPELLTIPARVRFLSCEPLLGPVDLGLIDHRAHTRDWDGVDFICLDCSTEDNLVRWFIREPTPIDWVIVGGESGPHHRPLNLDYARSLRKQCVAGRVAFFFKQVGGRTPTAGGDTLDGVLWQQFPVTP